jgi:hypothetical protein
MISTVVIFFFHLSLPPPPGFSYPGSARWSRENRPKTERPSALGGFVLRFANPVSFLDNDKASKAIRSLGIVVVKEVFSGRFVVIEQQFHVHFSKDNTSLILLSSA